MNLIDWIKTLNPAGWQSFGQSSGQNSNEQGQDYPVSAGTRIPGIAGIVTAVQNWGVPGDTVSQGDYAVTIAGKDGNLYTVGHVSPLVKVGDTLNDGDPLGISRGLASSISSGPHVEFQVTPEGSSGVVDPIAWLKGNSTTGTKPTNPYTVPKVGSITTASGAASWLNPPQASATGPFAGIIQAIQNLANQFANIGKTFDTIGTSITNVGNAIKGPWQAVTTPGNWWRIALYIVGGIITLVGILTYTGHAGDVTKVATRGAM